VWTGRRRKNRKATGAMTGKSSPIGRPGGGSELGQVQASAVRRVNMAPERLVEGAAA